MRMKCLAFLAAAWIGLVGVSAEAADLRRDVKGLEVFVTAPDEWLVGENKQKDMVLFNPKATAVVVIAVGPGEATYEWLEREIAADGRVTETRRVGETLVGGRGAVSLTGVMQIPTGRVVMRYNLVPLGRGRVLLTTRALRPGVTGAEAAEADAVMRALRIGG